MMRSGSVECWPDTTLVCVSLLFGERGGEKARRASSCLIICRLNAPETTDVRSHEISQLLEVN